MLGMQMWKLFVIAAIPMIFGCASKPWQRAPETILVTKKAQIDCNDEAMQKCEGIAIDSIGNAFHGNEAFIQAATALDQCKDRHASLVNCINKHNRQANEDR